MSAQRKAVAPAGTEGGGKGETCERADDTQNPHLTQHRCIVTPVPSLDQWSIRVLLPCHDLIMGNYPTRSVAFSAAKRFAALVDGKVLP